MPAQTQAPRTPVARPGVSTPSRRAPARFSSRTAPAAPPQREPGDDGHEGNGQSASPKQINFLRSLGQQGGLSYGQLSALAEETYGVKDLRALTKRQASQLIDQLRAEAA